MYSPYNPIHCSLIRYRYEYLRWWGLNDQYGCHATVLPNFQYIQWHSEGFPLWGGVGWGWDTCDVLASRTLHSLSVNVDVLSAWLLFSCRSLLFFSCRPYKPRAGSADWVHGIRGLEREEHVHPLRRKLTKKMKKMTKERKPGLTFRSILSRERNSWLRHPSICHRYRNHSSQHLRAFPLLCPFLFQKLDVYVSDFRYYEPHHFVRVHIRALGPCALTPSSSAFHIPLYDLCCSPRRNEFYYRPLIY